MSAGPDIMSRVVESCNDPAEAKRLLKKCWILTPAEIRKLEKVAKKD
jgi:hypothetical protein